MVSDLYDVTLVDFRSTPRPDETPPEALSRVFGIDRRQAERLLAKAPMVVKHAATAREARAYGAALEGIGARVRISETLHAPPAQRPTGPATPRPAPAASSWPVHDAVPASPWSFGAGNGADSLRCASHPGSLAVVACLGCGRPLCAGCVCQGRLGEVEATLCPTCHAAERTRVETSKPGGGRAFLRELPRAFLYPFRGRGLPILLVGTLFFTGAYLLASVSLFGFLVSLFVAGYLAAYMTKVVVASADGEDEAPDWPDFGNFVDDVLWPLLRVVGAIVACFGPAAAPFFLLEPAAAAIVALALVVAGTVVFPMALLALSVHGSVRALTPVVLFRGLAATWRVYPLALLVMVLVYVGVSLLKLVPGVGLALGTFLSLWVLLAEMRILGALYRTHSDRICWL